MLEALLTNKEREFKLAILKDNPDDKTLPIETVVAQRSLVHVRERALVSHRDKNTRCGEARYRVIRSTSHRV